jgi:hypothetical protein
VRKIAQHPSGLKRTIQDKLAQDYGVCIAQAKGNILNAAKLKEGHS